MQAHFGEDIRLNRAEMKKFIQGLNTDQASQTLKALLDDTPDFTKKIYDVAMKVIGGVDSDDIKEDVYFELDMLDVEDMSNRSGRTRYGYVEPYDAAYEMFEEALYPFIEEMKKNQQRELPILAKAHCIGIIKGLQQYENESTSDFKDWVVDAPLGYVHNVIDEWKKGKPSKEDIADIMSFVECVES